MKVKSMATKSSLAAAILLSFSLNAFADKLDKDANLIETACKADAAKMGCEREGIGSGLLKCMNAFQQRNKDFRHSPACQGALDQMKEDRMKEERR